MDPQQMRFFTKNTQRGTAATKKENGSLTRKVVARQSRNRISEYLSQRR